MFWRLFSEKGPLGPAGAGLLTGFAIVLAAAFSLPPVLILLRWWFRLFGLAD